MKARIRIKKDPERVLYYSPDPQKEKLELLSQTAREMGIEWVFLEKQDFSQKLGFLAGLPGYQERKQNAEDLGEQIPELMVMSLPQERVNRFLSALEGKKAEKVALKAMVTPHNRDWTLSHLVEEIGEEHQLFQAYERLQEQAALAQKKIQEGKVPEEKRDALSLWIQKAKGISSLQTMSLRQIEEIAQGIGRSLETQSFRES